MISMIETPASATAFRWLKGVAMKIRIELCPPDKWDSMVEIFTEMEEHY